MPGRIEQIMERLTEKTKDGSVTWKANDGGFYTAVVDNMRFRVSTAATPEQYRLDVRDAGDDTWRQLSKGAEVRAIIIAVDQRLLDKISQSLAAKD